jgi:hypothetical protein
MQIIIRIRTPELPTVDDWQRLFRYLADQERDTGNEGIEELDCMFVPSAFRPEEQYTNTLYNEPIWRTTDDSGFKLWLYADGSDSEG